MKNTHLQTKYIGKIKAVEQCNLFPSWIDVPKVMRSKAPSKL